MLVPRMRSCVGQSVIGVVANSMDEEMGGDCVCVIIVADEESLQ